MKRDIIMGSLLIFLIFVVLPISIMYFTTPQTTYINQVEKWARELYYTTPAPPKHPSGAYGNCLPVAYKIVEKMHSQKRIAVIVVTHPRPEKPWYHAMVLFDSDNNGTLDSVIDNGFSTGFKVQSKSDLDSGKFGKVYGVCITDDPQSMACRISPLP